MKITAKTIKDVLAAKHAKDVFIAECKTGPSQFQGCPRLDGWAMKRSWASPLSVGYEIKVSRSDFLGDRKWMNYLPYCNEFYFVCPPKLIDVSEVGSEAGLMHISSTGTRLYTKKKAPYRDLAIPEEFYRYILMCRTEIARYELSLKYERTNDEAFWRDWFERRSESCEFGHRVSKKIRDVVKNKIYEVESKQRVLEKKIEKYENIRQLLKKLGIEDEEDSYGWFESQFRRKVEGLQKIYPERLDREIDMLTDKLNNFKSELHKLKKEAEIDGKN